MEGTTASRGNDWEFPKERCFFQLSRVCGLPKPHLDFGNVMGRRFIRITGSMLDCLYRGASYKFITEGEFGILLLQITYCFMKKAHCT